MDNTTVTSGHNFNEKRFVALLVFLLSSILLYITTPRLLSAFNHIAIDSAINKLNDNKNINPDYVRKLITLAQDDLAVNDNARYWQDSSTLLFYQAQSQIGSDILQQTQHSIEQSLARSPANAYLWYRLAAVTVFLHQPDDKVAKMLIMSIMTGPNELGYLLPRLDLCLMVVNQFNKDDIEIVREQLLTAWKMSPSLFMATFTADEQTMTTITHLLEDDPSLLKEIMTRYEKVN